MSEHKIEQFAHRIELAVRWGDMDGMGHVNNAKFFTYGESGRIAYFDELGALDPRFWKDYGFILAHASCDYIAQIHYPATLIVGTRVARIGRSSIELVTAMYRDQKLVAVVKGVVAWFDYANRKTLPIPQHVRAWIRARELIKPEE